MFNPLSRSKALVLALLSICVVHFSGCDKLKAPSPDAAKPAQKANSPTRAAVAPSVKVQRWGPTSTPKGEVFNKQPNGLSALWMGLEFSAPPVGFDAYFGEAKLAETHFRIDGAVLIVPTELLAAPARVPVYLIHTATKTRTDIGSFDILPKPEDVPSLKITRWGPDTTKAGEPFNKQPNGESALWWAMTGWVNPTAMEIWFGNTKLAAPNLISHEGGNVLVPNALIAKPGKHQVFLKHKPSGTKFALGEFNVTP